MYYTTFGDNPSVAILIKQAALKSEQQLSKYYMQDLDSKDFIALSVDYGDKKKPNKTIMESYCTDELFPVLQDLGITTILCADGEYFKHITGCKKADAELGYVRDCKYDANMKVIYTPNYQSALFDPKAKDKIALACHTLETHLKGTYTELGGNIIKAEIYPKTDKEIEEALEGLLDYPMLGVDIETFSLFFGDAGLGTIGFAPTMGEGVAFCVDYVRNKTLDTKDKVKGKYVPNPKRREMVRNFFERYQGKVVWHNGSFDMKVLVYTLFMNDYLDYDGLVHGVEVMTRNFEDTKLITYLATNSCAGNELGLKAQAHEFAGNYAESEINDITRIPEAKLLRYNLVDCLSTLYVYDKHYSTMVADNQLHIYEKYFKPFVKQMLQMELVGMPIDMDAVKQADKKLTRLQSRYNNFLQSKLEAIGYMQILREREAKKYNDSHVKKKKTAYDYMDLEFNNGSPQQKQDLLYGYFGLPILDRTDTGQPACGHDEIEKLLNHVDDIDAKQIIRALMRLTKIDKIISSFIPNFLNATPVSDGTHRLYGNFNLGGTKSGRLSSSNPNLQQIPSNSTFAKLIKKCFAAPKDMLFGGADYNSLEDYVSALTTQDPNKVKVYEDGYDGHCLRAYYYFKNELGHLKENPDEVNSIQEKFPALRQDSKAPTFALTYQGTWRTLMNNCGFSEEKSKSIETAYHEMYKVSDEWVAAKIDEASKKGYVEGCYGLRLRTPALKKVVWNGYKIPYEAMAESRTAGNMLGQSYGMVTSRAAAELQERINRSVWRTKVHICALIHDAIYLMFPNDVRAVKWVNDTLVECMENHECEELDWHPTVKIGAALDIFYPDWSKAVGISNYISEDEIMEEISG